MRPEGGRFLHCSVKGAIASRNAKFPGSSSVKGEKNWAHFKTVCGDGELMFAWCLGWCLAQAGWHLAAVAFLNISPGKKAHCHYHLFSFVGKLGVKSGLFLSLPPGPSKL